MQFVPYINSSLGYLTRYNIIPLMTLFLITMFLSACSSTQGQQDKVTEKSDWSRIIKDITDLVELPWNEDTQQIQSPNRKMQPLLDTKNAYLEQEKRLMSEVPNDVIITYQQALLLMGQHEWQAASVLFDHVIAKQPNLSGSYVNQALILTELSKLQKQAKRTEQLNAAELWIDKAISVNSLNPYAQYAKGKTLQDKGLFEQAEQRYAEALSIWPNYAQAQLNMAILLELYRGKLLEAYPYYTAYLQQNMDDKQVQRWQAALEIKIKRAGLRLPVQKGE